MSILLDDDDARRGHYLEYAQNLLEHFVDTCPELYGETFQHITSTPSNTLLMMF